MPAGRLFFSWIYKSGIIMEIHNCEYCGYSGQGINIRYWKDGSVKIIVCPVCFMEHFFERKNKKYSYRLNVTTPMGSPVFRTLIGGWTLALSATGFLMFFNNENDIVATMTIICLVVGLLCLYSAKKQNIINNYIQRRIDEFKKTGEIPNR